MRALYLKLSTIKSWQASLLIAVTGGAVFASGLTSPFQGDDLLQIVDNPIVHSLKNLPEFFQHSTFYGYDSTKGLTGSYYRPLMTTTFSLLYTLFGLHSFYFHLFQLLLSIASSILLYLFFRYSFKPPLALFLSLVFLLHPLDSDVVYMIPCMQDVLMFFFGILGIYLLVKFSSVRSLVAVTLCFVLALFAKESALAFIGIGLLFLFWWDRKRVVPFLGILIGPVIIYVILRIHAVGLLVTKAQVAPIQRIDITGRLLTIPSILAFYLTKLIFPWKLANAYFWIEPKFSFAHVLLPAVIDLIVLCMIIYAALRLRARASKALFYTFLFFGVWVVLGILPILQIIPLDMTASEAWFYIPMAGILGLSGTLWTVYAKHMHPEVVMIIAILLIGVLGIRTSLRGFDYASPEALAYKNIAASKEDYLAYELVATYKINQGQTDQALPFIKRSLAIFPSTANYNLYGMYLLKQQDFQAARKSYIEGLQYASSSTLYDGLAKLTVVTGSASDNWQLLTQGLKLYPHDPNLWLYMALLEERYNDNSQAIIAINNAEKYGSVPGIVYQDIISNTPFKVYLQHNQSVTI